MKYFVLALMLLSFATKILAQTRITAQSPSGDISFIEDFRKELRSYELFNLQIEQANALLAEQLSNPTLILELRNQQLLELILEPANLKTEDYQVTIHTTQGYQPGNPNPVYTYQGYLKNNPESTVRLTVTQDRFSGVIQNYQGDNLHFMTLRDQNGQVLVIYKDSDLLQPTFHNCGNPEVSKSDHSGKRTLGLAAACVLTEIYLIADAAAVAAFGGSPASAEANMLEVLNLVNSHYEPVGVKYQVAGIFISTDPNGPWEIRSEADDQLDAAISWFNNQNFPGDVFTFWSDPAWDYSYAYVGAICSSFGGNLCAAWGGLTANTLNSNTQAHELGHNFNAGHDGSGIMRSTVSNQPSSFSNNSISVMTSYIPSVVNVCLDECVDDCSSFMVDAGPNQTVCSGENIQLLATATEGSSFSWSPTIGLDNPNIANPTVNLSTTTTYTLTASNGNGCVAEGQVIITVQDLPVADAGTDQVLSCNSSVLNLNGAGSSGGNAISYLWTTSNGNITSGATSATPTVDATGTYILTVVNQSTGCQAQDQVVVTHDTSLPTADAGADQIITCVVTSVNLNGSNSSQGANYTYLWTTSDGSILAGADTDQATTGAPGLYTLTVTETGSGCTSFDQVQVVQETELPIADAGEDKVLGCNANVMSVGGNNTSVGSKFSYQWSTADGNFSGGTQSITAQVTASGTYELLVTNTLTGCYQVDNVVVTEDTSLPVVTAGGNQILSCQATKMTLNGTGSEAGSHITYLWTTNNGNIVSGEASLFPVIDQPGEYTLSVTNEITGCQSSNSVTISLSATPPSADGGADQELTCSVISITLDGSGSSSGANISYQWTTAGGNIVSGANTLVPLVDSKGIYTLTVTDTGTGCESTDEVVVSSNAEVPRADAGRDLAIGCTSTTVDLRGDNSSSGSQYTYLWTTADGNMVTGQNSPILTVNAAGTYTLTIIDSNTGCTSSDDVQVVLDNTLPRADAGLDRVINCQNSQVQLDGSNSDQGNEIRYRWTTIDGNIVSGGSDETAVVDLAGTYRLTVINTNSGCSQSDEVVVTGNTTAPQATAGTTKVLDCQHPTAILGDATVQGNEAANRAYRWTTDDGNIISGANTPQAMVDIAGTYILTVTNTENNCVSQDQVRVLGTSEPPAVYAGEDRVVTLGDAVQLQAESNNNVTYQWSPEQVVDNPSIANPMATPDRTVTLTVTVIDINNCVAQDEITLTVPLVEDLKIPNSFSPNGDGVNDTWNIPGLEYLGSYTLEIFNRLGNSVHRGSNTSWDGTFRGDVLPTGTYFYIFNFVDQGSLAGHVNIIK